MFVVQFFMLCRNIWKE